MLLQVLHFDNNNNRFVVTPDVAMLFCPLLDN